MCAWCNSSHLRKPPRSARSAAFSIALAKFPPPVRHLATGNCTKQLPLKGILTKKERDFMTDENTKRIAELNDQFRKNFAGGQVLMTAGITDQPAEKQAAIVSKVRNFDNFTPDNDPYKQHDFGSFTHENLKIFWKIDYYALDMMHGSENPADPKQTSRVLTIMLASEY